MMTTPSVQAYKTAFLAVQNELPTNARLMLKLHYDAPDHTLTATEFAGAMGYKHYGANNLQYGRVGRLICEELNLRPKYKSAALVLFEKAGPKEHWQLIMRQEVAQALAELGWV